NNQFFSLVVAVMTTDEFPIRRDSCLSVDQTHEHATFLTDNLLHAYETKLLASETTATEDPVRLAHLLSSLHVPALRAILSPNLSPDLIPKFFMLSSHPHTCTASHFLCNL